MKRIRAQFKKLHKDILNAWNWHISSLPKEKGYYLSQLFYRAFRDEKLTFSDQKKIHKFFGVWIRKSHASNALYGVYPYFLQKNPEFYEDLRLIEVWGSLYSYCDTDGEKAFDHENIADLFRPSEESTNNLALILDEILPWYSFFEVGLVDDSYDVVTDVINDALVNVITESDRKKEAQLAFHMPGIYQFMQSKNFQSKNYDAAIKLARQIHGYSHRIKIGSENSLVEKVSKILVKDVFCRAKLKDEGIARSLFMAGLAKKLLEVTGAHCYMDDVYAEFCRTNIMTRLAQVDKTKTNYDYHYEKLEISVDASAKSLQQYKSKKLDKKQLGLALLGNDGKQLENQKCSIN